MVIIIAIMARSVSKVTPFRYNVMDNKCKFGLQHERNILCILDNHYLTATIFAVVGANYDARVRPCHS